MLESETMQIDHRQLQTIHRMLQQLTELNGQIERCPRLERAADLAQADAEKALADLKTEWTNSKKMSDEKQLQLRQREARLNTMLGQRNACTNNREYQLLTDQMAADKQANAVLSDEILELMERMEQIDAEQKTARAKVETAKTDAAKVRKDVAEKVKKLQAEVHRISSELALEEKKLGADVKLAYTRIRPKLAENSLAPTEGESCGNCFEQFTVNTLVKLRQSKLVQCQSCNAILYFGERALAEQN